MCTLVIRMSVNISLVCVHFTSVHISPVCAFHKVVNVHIHCMYVLIVCSIAISLVHSFCAFFSSCQIGAAVFCMVYHGIGTAELSEWALECTAGL